MLKGKSRFHIFSDIQRSATLQKYSKVNKQDKNK